MQRLVWWVQWHRRLGAVVAVLVLALAVTGILINHSQQLGWHQQPVYSRMLAWLYNIPVAPVESGYAVGDRWIVQVGEQLHLDQRPMQRCAEPLQSAVSITGMLAVLCGSHLLLLDGQGELIEQVTNLPTHALALAVQDERLLLQTVSAVFAYDDSAGEWLPASGPVNRAQPQALPESLRQYFSQHNPVPGLSWERVLLDLHSGRLFGNAGVLVVDLVGVAICLLAFSGLLTWFGRKLRHRKRHQH